MYLAIAASVALIALWLCVLQPGISLATKLALGMAATAIVSFLLAFERWQARMAGDRREVLRRLATAPSEGPLRRRVFGLCAGLELGLKLCERCVSEDPGMLAAELQRLRSAVEDFLQEDLQNYDEPEQAAGSFRSLDH